MGFDFNLAQQAESILASCKETRHAVEAREEVRDLALVSIALSLDKIAKTLGESLVVYNGGDA